MIIKYVCGLAGRQSLRWGFGNTIVRKLSTNGLLILSLSFLLLMSLFFTTLKSYSVFCSCFIPSLITISKLDLSYFFYLAILLIIQTFSFFSFLCSSFSDWIIDPKDFFSLSFFWNWLNVSRVHFHSFYADFGFQNMYTIKIEIIPLAI